MKIKEQYILMILIYYGGHQPDKVYLLLVASPGKMLYMLCKKLTCIFGLINCIIVSLSLYHNYMSENETTLFLMMFI